MGENTGLKLSPLISDGMVLQRKSPVVLWGQARPSVKVILSFLEREYDVLSDDKGYWEVTLKDLEHGGPYKMEISTEDGDKITVKDILIGDVWVLGGQSNMQIQIARTLDLFEDEVKGASNSNIRKFSVPEKYNFQGPLDELTGGEWIEVNPESVYDFSAIGYFFAEKIYDKYKVPIGLVHAAIGGTPAEAWVSEETLMRFGRFQEEITINKDDAYVKGTQQREEARNNRWYNDLYKNDLGINGSETEWFKDEIDDSDWNEIELPRRFTGTELENHKGSIWLRKEIMVPEDLAGKEARLVLGTLVDGDDTYLNGEQVGNTGYLYPPRRYNIREGLLKPGKNIITVRLIVTSNVPAFVTDMPYFLQVEDEKIPVSGTWKYKVGASMETQKPTTFFQYKPTGVYNAMIYPLRRYAIKGVLWYQGESNTGHPHDYKELFEAVISDWRKVWNLGDFPFLYVQLANFCPWREEPEVSGWARLRDEQRKVLQVPNTGMAVTIDVGMYNDLHPWDKKTVGERLALWAQNKAYGEDIVCSGPIYNSYKVEGDKIRLYFDHIGSGLISKDGEELKTFEICGKDKIFKEGKAEIDGETVLVHSQEVKEPEIVRYAWADNPEEANLYNKEGLPASPFISK